MLDQMLSHWEVDLIVATQELEHVGQLGHRVTFFYYDLLGPVDQGGLGGGGGGGVGGK